MILLVGFMEAVARVVHEFAHVAMQHLQCVNVLYSPSKLRSYVASTNAVQAVIDNRVYGGNFFQGQPRTVTAEEDLQSWTDVSEGHFGVPWGLSLLTAYIAAPR